MRAGHWICLLFLVAFGADARQADLEWDAVAGAAGYRLYVGTESGVYGDVYDTGSSTLFTVANLDPWQRYYFAATAYAGADESGFSNEIQLAAAGATNVSADQICTTTGEPPVMAVPTFVQQKNGAEIFSAASQTVTFDSSVASGNGIVVLARSDVSGNTGDTLDGATVSDGTNTYVFRNSQVRGFSGTGYNFAIWTASAISSGAFAVTVTPEVTSSSLRVSIIEIGNWDGVPAITQSIANYSSSLTTDVSWNFTNTTTADYLLLAGANTQGSATHTPAAGWTDIAPGSEMPMIYKTAASSTPDANDPGVTLGTARRWVGVAIAIPGGAGGGAASIVGDVSITVSPSASVIDFTRHASITGALTATVTPAAALDFTQNAGISGDSAATITPAAALQFQRHASINGALSFAVTPAGVLDFTRHAAIAGDLALTITPAATLDFTGQRSISGDISVNITPAAVLDFTRHAAITGTLPVSLIPAAAMDFTRHAALAGDASATITPSATLNFNQHASIAGALTIAITPAGALDFQQHRALIGALSLSLTPSATMQFSTPGSIVGSVPVVLTPAAALDFTRHASLSGSIPLSVIPAATLDFSQHPALAGALSFALTPVAAMQFTEAAAAIVGDSNVVVTPSAALAFQQQADITGAVTITITPAGVLVQASSTSPLNNARFVDRTLIYRLADRTNEFKLRKI